ncbi:MAG: hypothetical protein RR101_15285, partial [Burkholderiaceae bacterium]
RSMSGYYLAPSLDALRDEVNARYPRRDKASDGWIGDPSHAARPSDHNPDWKAPKPRTGVVRALDVDVDDRDPRKDLRLELINALIGDPRVWYIISNGVIYSRTHGWEARKYKGDNGHYSHVHVSILATPYAESNRSPWLDVNKVRVRPGAINLDNVRDQFRMVATGHKANRRLNGVKRVQATLNRIYGTGLTVDGIVGPATVAAWRKHEKATAGTGRPGVPDVKSLAALLDLDATIIRTINRKK